MAERQVETCHEAREVRSWLQTKQPRVRRFEYEDGKSSKFWEVDVRGGELHLNWGRIGTSGQSKVKDLGTPQKAADERDKQIASKVKKGYTEVQGTTNGTPERVVAKPELKEAPTEPAHQPEPKAPTQPAQQPQPGATETTAPQPEAPQELPNESDLYFPDAWIRYIIPQRGDPRMPNFRPLKTGEALELCRAALAINPGLTKEQWEQAKASLENEQIPAVATAPAGYALALAQNSAKARKAWIDLLVQTRGVDFATAALLHSESLIAEGTRCEFEWEYNYYYRLRKHLAFCSEEEHSKAVQSAAPLRRTLPERALPRCAFLFPSRMDWLQELDSSDYFCQPWLVASLSDRDNSSRLAGKLTLHSLRRGPLNLYPTLLNSLGLAAGPILAARVGQDWVDAEMARKTADALACFPQEEAFLALMTLSAEQKTAAPAFLAALQRFPRLALRVLSKKREGELAVRQIFDMYPSALESVREELSADQLQWLDGLRKATPTVAKAPEPACPKFLITPPWLTAKKPKSVKLELDLLDFQTELSWESGQKESWFTVRPWSGDDMSLEKYYSTLNDWQRSPYQIPVVIASGPPSAAAKLLREFQTPSDLWYLSHNLSSIVARFGLEALPLLKQVAERKLAEAVPFFDPFVDIDLCRHAAEAYSRLKSVRGDALRYLCRHPRAAAVALIPDAFGKAAKPRAYAEEALLAVARSGLEEPVLEVAAEYGVAAHVTDLLGRDPLERLPKKIPDLPDWLENSIGVLPPLILLDGSGALPDPAVRNFLVMLSISQPDEVYPGVTLACSSLQSESAAEFAWQLFEIWTSSGASSKEYWAFQALGWLGNDQTARRLTPILKKWPGEGLHARAVVGLDVLTSIGSDVSLMHLFGLSQKLKFKGLKNKAAEKVEEIAENRGLTPEELADRLVPDFGLDEAAAMTLDYGSRTFTLGFDEHLKPLVKDESGKLLKSLPKPGKRDDEKANEEFARFKALKKDVKTVAKQQLSRLEQAMCHQRRWTAEDFRNFFLEHPLVIHLVRRLIWATFEEDKVTASFRVAEDGTLADSNDDEWELPDQATVGLPHRLELSSEELSAWGEVLADYELLQPFPQLNRDVYPRPAEHVDTDELDLVRNKVVDTGKVLGMESRGWHRGEAQDGGVSCWIYREFPSSCVVHLDLEPGIAMGDPFFFKEQKLHQVTLKKTANAWSADSNLSFSCLTEVFYSELVRDLEALID